MLFAGRSEIFPLDSVVLEELVLERVQLVLLREHVLVGRCRLLVGRRACFLECAGVFRVGVEDGLRVVRLVLLAHRLCLRFHGLLLPFAYGAGASLRACLEPRVDVSVLDALRLRHGDDLVLVHVRDAVLAF